MNFREREEFAILLLLENNCYNSMQFANHIKDNYDIDKFNNRYRELLDKFLNDYALNKTEKSDENVAASE